MQDTKTRPYNLAHQLLHSGYVTIFLQFLVTDGPYCDNFDMDCYEFWPNSHSETHHDTNMEPTRNFLMKGGVTFAN